MGKYLTAVLLTACAATSVHAQGALPDGWTEKTTTVPNMKAGDFGVARAQCAPGERVTGGGWHNEQADLGFVALGDQPFGNPTPGWEVPFKYVGPIQRNVTVTVYVGCQRSLPVRHRR